MLMCVQIKADIVKDAGKCEFTILLAKTDEETTCVEFIKRSVREFVVNLMTNVIHRVTIVFSMG